METILKISRSAIYSSLRKYGISMFKLEILVYCEPEKCVKLEQKYINFFKPPYNILKIAGSPLGVIRSPLRKLERKYQLLRRVKIIRCLGKLVKIIQYLVKLDQRKPNNEYLFLCLIVKQFKLLI